VLTDGAAPTLWLVGPDADVSEVGAHVEVVRADDEAFAPDRILDLLRDRGLRRVLVEGGGTTVSRFLAAGCLGPVARDDGAGLPR
jgi:3,4-dihydroxy 2-butanone 4-phosphate synthase/GTP cyclohydrolase II